MSMREEGQEAIITALKTISAFNDRVYKYSHRDVLQVVEKNVPVKMPCAYVRYAGLRGGDSDGGVNVTRGYGYHVVIFNLERDAAAPEYDIIDLAEGAEAAIRGLAVGHQDVQLALANEDVFPTSGKVIVCYQEYMGMEYNKPINLG